MDVTSYLVVFSLDEQRFALSLAAVDRIVRAVEVTPLPEAHGAVLGVINVLGQVVPVVNLRKRCRMPEREVDPGDQFIIAHTATRKVALWVDSAEVVPCDPGALVQADQVLPGLGYAKEMIKGVDGLILIYDPASLLSVDEVEGMGAAAVPLAGPKVEGGAR